MLDKAIAKIKAEMDGNNAIPYVKAVGQFVLQYLTMHPETAEKINAEGKTVAGSMKEMETVARAKKSGSMAVLTPDEGFGIVMKYYGIEDKGTPIVKAGPVVTAPFSPPAAPPAAPAKSFSVSLDDLL